MYFDLLRQKLVSHLREHVRNGNLTERGLARLTGISQPHIHNVLKGARILSPDLADIILRRLDITILDLLERQHIVEHLSRGAHEEQRHRSVPVLQGLLGPGLPLPRQIPGAEQQSIPASLAASLTAPVVARLAPDEEMAGVFEAGELVLLDQSETARSYLQASGNYVVLHQGSGKLRSLRRENDRLYLISEAARDRPSQWETVSLSGREILDVVLARVVWLSRRRRWEDLA